MCWRAEPCERLRLGWRGPDGEHDAAGRPLDTEVTFTVVPTDAGGTRLTVFHEGFPATVKVMARAQVIVVPIASRDSGEPTMMGGYRWAA